MMIEVETITEDPTDNRDDNGKQNGETFNKKPAKRRSRIFNPNWEMCYGFLQKDKNRSICTMCNITIISRAYNIQRHYRQVHELKLKEEFKDDASIIAEHIVGQVRKFKESYPNYRLVVPANCSSNTKVYNTVWTIKFGFVKKDRQHSVCTICYDSVPSKHCAIESHYKDRHYNSLKHLTKDSLREYLQNSVKVFNDYHQYQSSADAPTTFESRKASFIVAFTVAKMDKTAGEGEYLRDCFLQISDILFANYPNKDEIRNDLEKMSVSRFSVRRHIDTIVDDINRQLNLDLEKCEAFSIRLDQSVSRKDVTRMAVSARFYSHQFGRIIEEVLMIEKISGESNSRDLDSLELVNALVQKYDLGSKLFSVCVDGARQTTALTFVRQLQQLLTREILVFNMQVPMVDRLVAMLKQTVGSSAAKVPLPLTTTTSSFCSSSTDISQMLKFILYPDQFYYNNVDENFLDFNCFKFLNLESFYNELALICADPAHRGRFQLMRQQMTEINIQQSSRFLEILLETWKYFTPKSGFSSIYKIFSSILSIFVDESTNNNNRKLTELPMKAVHSSLNPCRSRLKMNHTEESIRLQLTNYSPDFDRILLGVYRKKKPGNPSESKNPLERSCP